MPSLGYIPTEEHRRRISESKKGQSGFAGKKHTEETKRKIGLKSKGRFANEKHFFWKGDDVGYSSLHKWINKNLGRPTVCEHCQANGLSGKKIHWANKSGKYKRTLSDWIRLCVSCHKKYDLERKNN